MYEKFVPYFIIGIIATFVPLNLIGAKMREDPTISYKYINLVKYGPIMFGLFNVALFYVTHKLNINNFWIIGVIASIFISSYGRFVQEIPTKVFKMKNPNMFHVQALLVWCLFYGIVAQFVLRHIKC